MAAKTLSAPFDDPISCLRAVVPEALPDGFSSLATNLIVAEILDAARQSATSAEQIYGQALYTKEVRHDGVAESEAIRCRIVQSGIAHLHSANPFAGDRSRK